VSLLWEAFSRLFALRYWTLQKIVDELNATLRRTEEARIYHWVKKAATYPPQRTGEIPLTARPVDGSDP
jgi:hypothetical protein